MKIGIIGGGLAGTLVALKCLEQFNGDLEIIMFEKEPRQLFRGIAYSSSLKFQPLNVRAGQMNLWQSRPGDFHQWLQQSWPKYFPQAPAPEDFVQRHIFGDYLNQIFQHKSQPHASKLKIILKELTHVERVENKLELTTDDAKFYVDHVVLALGNFPPGDVPIKNQKFYASSLYEATPWDHEWMTTVDPASPVLFLGAGLTAVDQVINLLDRGHQGPIYILSRRGLLPQPHKKYVHTILPPLDFTTGMTALELLQITRRRIKECAANGIDWRNVIDSIRERIPFIWSCLSMHERRRFLRHLRPFWEIHRHRIPELSLKILNANIASSKISTFAGSLVNIVEDNGEAIVSFRPRGKQHEKHLRVSKIINCTGPQTDFRKIAQPLVQNLLQKGWLKADELNLGLAVNEHGQLIDVHGKPNSNIFTIGSLRKGAMWECTALKEIAAQAEELVHHFNSETNDNGVREDCTTT